MKRTLADMVEQLETQLRLLREYSDRAFGDKQDEYLPEVAGKLRLLLVKSRHNKPLLLEVADQLGVNLEVTIHGPPGLQYPAGDLTEGRCRVGDRITLDAFFDLLAVGVKTSSGFITLTKRELIRAWCEQLGGVHEDWSVDEEVVKAIKTGLTVGGYEPCVLELNNCARSALQHGQRVLAAARANQSEQGEVD